MSDEGTSRLPVKPGDVIAGKYKVDRVLGAGGMGVVVAALHTELDQMVALKFILPEAITGKDAIERFMREARAVARLKSEHVARVFDVGRDELDRPYMVLELLDGHDLATLSKTRGPFAVADAVEYVLQACEALIEAHTMGIVHRDLKPQNLFVTRRLNGKPLVKVLDFGIAKAVGAAAVGQMALTDSQAVIGSPLYMAPEHMRSARAADTRSDIWSLGVILYELLGGQLPFDGETVTEVCIRVVNDAPASLEALRPGLDANLSAVAMRCLEKDPALRWQNVAQLATALEPYARSAEPGAAVGRPWRLLEQTGDVAPAGFVQVNPTAPTAASATSSAELQEAAARATKDSASAPPNTRSSESGQSKLVSTDVSWGEGASAGAPPSRSRFTAGIVVGVLLALGMAATIGFVSRSSPVATPAAGPALASSPIVSAQRSAPEASAAASAVASSEPTGAPSAGAAVASSSSSAKAKAQSPRGLRSTAVPSGRTPDTAPTAAPPASSPPNAAPNGAPILR